MKSLLLTILAIGLQVSPQTAGGVAGVIRLADGTPAASVRVSAMSTSDASREAAVVLENITQADGAGNYRLTGIAPGEYYIVAGPVSSLTFYPGAVARESARIVKVGPGTTTTGVDFVLQTVFPATPVTTINPPRAGISGTVVLEGARALPAFFPKLHVDVPRGTNRTFRGADGSVIRGSGTFGAVAVSQSGGFTLRLEDGAYDIALITSLGRSLSAAADGYYVKSMMSGTTDLLKQKLIVKGGTAPAIRIVLSPSPRPVP